jgi:hypothetical protein
MDCNRLGSTALASLATRVGPDAPVAVVSAVFLGLPIRAAVAVVQLRETASEPPPRNLLLVKNSFLI